MYSRREFLTKFAVGAGGAALLAFRNDALTRVKKAVKETPTTASAEEIAADEIFWSRIQSAFTLDRTVINFNNGGVCPSPRTVHEAFKRYLDYTNQNPAYHMWQHIDPNIESVRYKLALRFGCDAEEIAVTRNASEALEIVQFGLDFQPGDEVIITSQCYPRMRTTWEQIVRRSKIVLKKVKFPVPLINPDDYVEAVKKAITRKTKAIMVMHVINYTGQITPVKKISRLAHAHGIPVICDGAHSFSHFPFTIKDLECDYFGTSLHKWTYAPIGTGMLYVKKEKIKNLWPLMAADKKKDNDIRKFEEIGTHPAANHNAAAEALVFNETIGIDRKAARLRYLHMRWIDRLRKYKNVKFMINIEDPTQWCGLVNAYIEGVDVHKLADYLMKKHRVFVVAIKHDEFRGIRVTPNVYSLLSEVDLFAAAMEKVARGEVPQVMMS
ncbi:MAG: aminotransferase class V-fold PLP-dependent enzyme [Candidatus Aminicenantes bacterium]|nr:aminotransferase class V-fold PLP-dependent enzyme [Candidatus Aminicenantes bacterium]